jgi:ribosome biogenesis GTPase
MTAASSDDEFAAEVVAAFGRHLLVRTADARELRARPSGRRLSIVCGDRVRCALDRAHDEVLVVEVLPRRTLLARANLRGESEPVVANISQLVVVIAPVPVPDFFIVDADDELAAFAGAGYPHVACSAKAGAGLDSLRTLLAGGVSVLVGQSGVGKSSLVSALLPGANITTGELMREEEGRHTTTASRAYALESGGALIDSPGVRDFAPAVDQLDARTLGFPEVEKLARGCRFADCKHVQEPGCAIIAAVESGEISARRYESYRRLRRRYSDLIQAQGYGKRSR